MFVYILPKAENPNCRQAIEEAMSFHALLQIVPHELLTQTSSLPVPTECRDAASRMSPSLQGTACIHENNSVKLDDSYGYNNTLHACNCN